MASAYTSAVVESEGKARALRRSAGCSGFPTDVDHVCSILAIKLIKEDLGDDLAGMSFIKNGLKYIIINKSHHINRRRFTIAHEIGHHCLHEAYLTQNVHIDKSILNRDSLSASGTDLKEVTANSFAAELLMPASAMKQFFALDISDVNSISKAAEMFRVSQSAFTFRLINLAGRSSF